MNYNIYRLQLAVIREIQNIHPRFTCRMGPSTIPPIRIEHPNSWYCTQWLDKFVFSASLFQSKKLWSFLLVCI